MSTSTTSNLPVRGATDDDDWTRWGADWRGDDDRAASDDRAAHPPTLLTPPAMRILDRSIRWRSRLSLAGTVFGLALEILITLWVIGVLLLAWWSEREPIALAGLVLFGPMMVGYCIYNIAIRRGTWRAVEQTTRGFVTLARDRYRVRVRFARACLWTTLVQMPLMFGWVGWVHVDVYGWTSGDLYGWIAALLLAVYALSGMWLRYYAGDARRGLTEMTRLLATFDAPASVGGASDASDHTMA